MVLIVENDLNFAKILLDMARDKGFKGVVALDGDAGLDRAHAKYSPTRSRSTSTCRASTAGRCSIGSSTTRTRGTSRCTSSPASSRAAAGLKAGAIAYLEKPVSKEALDDAFARISQFIDTASSSLLVVEDDETQRQSIVELIGTTTSRSRRSAPPRKRCAELDNKHFDCMVLDLGLAGHERLRAAREGEGATTTKRDLPIIIYTGKELSQPEETRLRSTRRRSSSRT